MRKIVSLDLTLIGIGRRDIPQRSSKHFHMEAFYQTFSGGQRPSQLALFQILALKSTWNLGLADRDGGERGLQGDLLTFLNAGHDSGLSGRDPKSTRLNSSHLGISYA